MGVIRELVDRGIPKGHPLAQTVGDGMSNSGRGGGGETDSSSLGAKQQDRNFSRFPAPMRDMLAKAGKGGQGSR